MTLNQYKHTQTYSLTSFVPGLLSKLFMVFVLCSGIFSLASSMALLVPPTDTLPVVVHVIHTGTAVGSPDNPSDSQIQSLITLMNNAFQKNGSQYGGANIDLAFSLAKKSPSCQSTTGIIRVNGSGVTDYTLGGITTDTVVFPNSAHELFVKALSRWPNTDYINIWLVNMIDGNPTGTAGYAYFPEYNSALTDGVVLRANAANNTNKVVIHELGHYFNLDHTFGSAWQNCVPENNCATQGDQICDTEKCRFTFDCNESINPCTGNPYLIADPALNYTVLNNYMGYTGCQWMFTEGQKSRMLAAINNFRPGLLNSRALQLTPSETPVAACLPTSVNGLSQYYGIQKVEFGNMIVYSNSSLADGQMYIDRTCNQAVTVAKGQSVFVRITGSFQNTHKIRVYLDYNNNGVFDLPTELILTGNAGIVQNTITIPSNIPNCTVIRLRVVADNQSAPDPTPCMITGTSGQGAGQVEDYTVMIRPRLVTSVASGNWNTPSVWSCNCIPSATDAILITSGRTITVPLNLGTVSCASIRLQPTAQFIAFANVNVMGGCP